MLRVFHISDLHFGRPAVPAQIESLDRAIGDGDHYINVRRGIDVAMTLSHDLAALPPVHSREMSWLSGIRVVLPPDTFGVVPLPPRSPDTRLYELPEPIVGVIGESQD